MTEDLKVLYDLVYLIYGRQGEGEDGGSSLSKSISVVDELPTENADANKIYLIKNEASDDENNVYDEYIYTNDKYEKLGSFETKIDLSEYQKKLVSGENIKTINGEDILGEGDIEIKGNEIKAGDGVYISEDADGAKVISTSWLPNVTADTYVAYLNVDGSVGVDYFDDGNLPYDQYSGRTDIEEVVIGDGITSFSYYDTKQLANRYQCRTFKNCTNLKKLTLGSGITSFGYTLMRTRDGSNAFNGCTSLTNVIIPNSVTLINYQVFYGCSSLTSVTIGNSVTSIGDNAFYNCTSLTSVTIPDSVTSIGGSAFLGCSGLTSITIPNSVTSIGNSVFNGLPTQGTLYCDEDWYNNLTDGQKSNLGNVANWARKPLPKSLDERVDDIEESIGNINVILENIIGG